MTTFIRAALAALVLAAITAACTPAGSSSRLLPATHVLAPMDSGGGLPPGGHAPTTSAPSPTP